MKIYFFLFISTLCVVNADHLSSIIKEVFSNKYNNLNNNQNNNNLNNNQLNSVNKEESVDENDCVCVPYYLCKNTTKDTVNSGIGVIDIRETDGPCDHYLDVCCKNPMKQSERVTPPPTERKECGKHNPEGVAFRISGEENEAQYGEFPWMVAVHKGLQNGLQNDEQSYQCGGALIHPEVVLTAAHCIRKKSDYTIRIGEWDTQTANELYPHQDIAVKKTILHPEYYAGAQFYDVGLMFLEKPVILGETADVVCLPRADDVFDGAKCLASGWGKDIYGKEGLYQVILKKLQMPVIAKDKCVRSLRKTVLGEKFTLDDSFICAGGEGGVDMCNGDGGSPLVCPIKNKPGRYAQAGIVSWGIGCGNPGIPGVYANVALVRSWIDDQLEARGINSLTYQY